MMQLQGAEIAEREGIGTTNLLLRVLAMSLCYCIPPREIIAFGLYQRTSKKDVWDYIFSHEVPAFHRWRSSMSEENSASLALLQDKSGLANLLASHGIPMVPVLGVIPLGTEFCPAPYLQTYPRLFCKPRHGSASRDTFVVERRDKEKNTAVFAVKNGMKAQPSSLDSLQKAISKDDFLVQPLMGNHPFFATLCPAGDTITLRIITEQHQTHGPRCYCATLEIPDPVDGGYFHTILQIALSSGLVIPFSEKRFTVTAKARHDAILARLGDCTVPFWDEIKRSAMAAHEQLPELYAIAWDYVITPCGPFMLEGNSGWGTTMPQILLGGLLQNDIREN